MPDAIEELNKTGARSPMLEAYADYLQKLKAQGGPDKSGVVVDAVAVKPNGERTSLGYLKERVNALKVEVAKLNEKAQTSTAQAAQADQASQELERQSAVAQGESLFGRMESDRARIESEAEISRANQLEQQAQESKSLARGAKREADLLRAQGERALERAESEKSNESYQQGMSLLTQAGDREARVMRHSTEGTRLQGESRSRRQSGEAAQQRHKSAEQASGEAEKRSTSLKDQSRSKGSEASRLKLDAEQSRSQAAERTLEQQLMEKKADELVEMASQLEFIVAT